MPFYDVPPELALQSRESVLDVTGDMQLSMTDSAGYVSIDKMVARFKQAGEQLSVFRAASAPTEMPDYNPLFTGRALEDRLADLDDAADRVKQARIDYDKARKDALANRKKVREEKILQLAEKIATIRERKKEAPNESPSASVP